MEWKENELFFGEIKIGEVFYSVFSSKGDPNKIEATLFLPGVKSRLGAYQTYDEAKARVKGAATRWLKRASLTTTTMR